MVKKMEKILKKSGEPLTLEDLFSQQQVFQKLVTGFDTPVDNIVEFCYHMNAMQEELGEVLKADKRWKTHRNTYYNKEEKLEELADVFITMMNIAMYSGFDSATLLGAVEAKINKNKEKLKRGGNQNDSNS